MLKKIVSCRIPSCFDSGVASVSDSLSSSLQ